MIRAWRLTRRVHATPAARAYDGAGAERRGGRWNRMGTRAAYASATRSLAALEYLASVDAEDLPDDLVFVGLAIPEKEIEHGDPPAGWDALDSSAAAGYGERWLRSHRSLALAVPSAIVKAERNFVLNPAHANARALTFEREVEAFVFDARLSGKC